MNEEMCMWGNCRVLMMTPFRHLRMCRQLNFLPRLQIAATMDCRPELSSVSPLVEAVPSCSCFLVVTKCIHDRNRDRGTSEKVERLHQDLSGPEVMMSAGWMSLTRWEYRHRTNRWLNMETKGACVLHHQEGSEPVRLLF